MQKGRRGEDAAGRGGGLISEELSTLRLYLRAHITSIEKGLGGLLLDLSRRLLTHVELPGTNWFRSPRYLSRVAYNIWWSTLNGVGGHSHKALWPHANRCLKCFLRSGALRHRGIRDPGLFVRRVLFPLVVLASFTNRTLQYILYLKILSLARPYTLREVGSPCPWT